MPKCRYSKYSILDIGWSKITYIKHFGFTMAELMITIGVVGVVAAITIPLLIQNSNTRKFTTQLKKSLSTLNQAAISAQAQYDMDYGSLSSVSDPATCGRDKFSDSSATMCALFNSTLSAKHYLGVYGQVKGSILASKYEITKTTEGFDPTNFLIYSMADGSLVGFNPNAKRCSLESGQTINKTILTNPNGLANCIGFIDVNGVSLPNKEITCADGTSSLDTDNACTLKTTGSKVGDVYPVVFHDGTVEPATNAGKSEIGAGRGDGAGNADTPSEPAKPTTTKNGYKIGDRNDPTTWEAFVPTPLTNAQCRELIGEEYGIKACNYDNDYWAAAVKECGGVQNMLKDEDLTKLAQDLYPNCSSTFNSAPYCKSNLNTSKIPENLEGLGSSWYDLWSGSENSPFNASYRTFDSSSSLRSNGNRRDGSSFRAVCVGD